VNHYVVSQTTQMLATATGSTFPSISAAQLGALMVPLPPLAEQTRIVAAIEESLTDIESGVAALGAAEEDLTRFRASMLQAATTGELTRASAPPVDEPAAADLLESILRVRRERASPGDDPQGTLLSGPGSAYEEPTAPDLASLPPLPERWTWATFGQLCEVRLGRAKNPGNRAKLHATPYLRAANITEDGLDLSDVLEMDFLPQEVETYRLRHGDLVVSEASGSPDQVGKPAIWRDEMAVCCFQNTVIRLRPVSVASEFVLVLLQHCYFNRVFASLSGGVGINHLGAKRLARVPVPLAPAAEQDLIVASVAQHLDAVKQTRSEIGQELARSAQLRGAMLARAFQGELVPPVPGGEPVSELLASLQARREEDREARKLSNPVKRVQRMPASQRRPILEVLGEYPDGISPEDLLAAANYPPTEVDEFYARLADVWDSVTEEKPAGENAFEWPDGARVLLRPKMR
jgi:type I restriction enzyme S subunit